MADPRLVAEWFQKGKEDLQVSELLLVHRQHLATTAFHIQQALEKHLKGYLISKGWRLVRTHDLENLISEAIYKDKDFEPYLPFCRRISDYYFKDRYPGTGEYRWEEVEASFKRAVELIGVIKKKVAV